MTDERAAELRQHRAELAQRFASNARDTKAQALADGATSWIPFTSKDGRYKGFCVPSSQDGKYYTVTIDDCDCPDAQRHTTTCKHRRALRLVLERQGILAEFMPAAVTEGDAAFWARLGVLPTTRED